jgi:predicted Rossmann fold nucleotide-binding protein DprA/Smf involved in DNA uptake
MAKNETDLFDRLRKVGVRKQVAKTLSDIGDGASKKAVKAAQSAAAELRSLADEIERRLPHISAAKAGKSATARRATAPASASRSAGPAPKRAATGRTAATGSAAGTRSATASSNGARAPRGQNKAKILASLKTGPKTASEIAKETGIGTGTVGSTLSKMATAGEVRKAERGYGLPS